MTVPANADARLNSDFNLDLFFHYFESQKVPFCVLGPLTDSAKSLGGDVDIVLAPQSPNRCISKLFLSSCQARGIAPVQHLHHEMMGHYFILWQRRQGIDHLFPIDLYGDQVLSGTMFLPAEEVTADRCKAVDVYGNTQAFYVPATATSFIYYLTKKLDKRELTDEHARYLSELWRKDPSEARAKVDHFFTGSAPEILARAAASGDWATVRSNFATLRKKFRRRWSVKILLADYRRIWRRIRQPTGLHVVFLGADGSGKSTILDKVYQDLKPLFRRRARYHLTPQNPLTSIHIPIKNPHGQPARGLIASLAKLVYLLACYSAGWLYRLWPAKVRSTGIFFDRYYHDILADPKRYRYGGPMWLARLVGHFIVQPDLWIILDAPAQLIHSRKREVSLDATRQQCAGYLGLAPTLHNAVVIDASLPIELVVSKVNQTILDFMARRTATRILGR